MSEEGRLLVLDGEAVYLTLTELQERLSGTPTKHVLAVWDEAVARD
ncbi:hypothetical protein ES702_03850 [subsurface metagenome]